MALDLGHIAHACGKASHSAGGWSCCCPVHDDKNPSLSLSMSGDGMLLAKCHAGCDFESIINALRGKGLLESHASGHGFKRPDRSEYAKAIWRGTHLASGTVVETYLQARGYTGPVPDSLRFHSRLKHAPSQRMLPAMVAGITIFPDNDVEAVHRTYLAHDGAGKAGVEPAKMMLGAVGGGAVRFGPLAGDTLWIAEGIETSLSIFLATGKPTWAVLSASGMKAVALPSPEQVPNLYIAADHDTAGIDAAETLAARELALGRKVRIAVSPVPGQDFNDVLREGVHVPR